MLDASASVDADSDTPEFAWTQVSGPAVSLGGADGAVASFVAPRVSGTSDLTFRLTVSDSRLTNSADVTLTVKNGPPLCDLARAMPDMLWPPDHRRVRVAIAGVADPDDDAVKIRIDGATQDEPVNWLGDGDTSPDAMTQDPEVLLRAERSAQGNGRVYVVGFTADDDTGGECRGSVEVVVPHDMVSLTSTAVDDGQRYEATAP
jgi:hypothetical protein